MLPAAKWREGRIGLLPEVVECYRRLEAECDLVIVEGAGSPAEVNLRSGDIANMGFARAAGVPVVLAGDIDRGGVIASLVGTKAVIDPEDAAMIRGFLVNKFRGDPALFADGMAIIAAHTGWHSLGLIPWLSEAHRLPSEDAVALERPAAGAGGRLVIACPITPRIANFDDLDPLRLEPQIDLVMVRPGQPIPEAAMIILAGSRRRSPTSRSCARRAGRSISPRIIGGASRCWGCAAGTRCSVGRGGSGRDRGPGGQRPRAGSPRCRDGADRGEDGAAGDG